MSPNSQEQSHSAPISIKNTLNSSSPGRQLLSSRPHNRGTERIWRVKLLRCLKRQRNCVDPNHNHPHIDQKALQQQPGCEFFTISSHRVIRVLRPELKAGRFYEPPRGSSTTPGGISGRRESIEDNFYARWARRPHPSGNCRCSFRKSTASSSASQVSLEELAVSQQINRIRASLCEAERSGRSAEAEIEHIERTLGLPLAGLANLQVQQAQVDGSKSLVHVPSVKEVSSRLEPLDERTRERIVEGLEKYISNLLDEILDETIRALAKADRPFDNGRPSCATTTTMTPGAFEINFSFHGDKTGEQKKSVEGDKGYVNQGFVGCLGDPDALNFQLRRDEVVADELAVDCVDSGINSVETIELQPEMAETGEQQQDLEQSLMEIIDAKLGGTSIGKSLENLGLEIDAEDRAANEGKTKDPEKAEARHHGELSASTIPDDDNTDSVPICRAEVQQHRVPKSSSSPSSTLGHLPQAPRPASERTSRSLDEVTEEPRFNSLRLQFKKRNNASNSSNTNKPSPTKSSPSQHQQQPRILTPRKLVSCRLNKTMRMIRRRLAARLACAPTRRKPASQSSNSPSKAQQQQQNQQQQQSSLELEDYRRRFPVPELRQGQKVRVEEDWEGSVRLRNRKPTLVFLHGFGSSADAFGAQLSYFAELGYPCIAPDLLGHGLSSAPSKASEYKFGKLLDDLETILSHYAFKPGHKCVIIAHNYGIRNIILKRLSALVVDLMKLFQNAQVLKPGTEFLDKILTDPPQYNTNLMDI
ncbi:hypothetical protein QAD02_015503 [Eretmocerus hayati]|uniref:Uncharacterized protein n=1 Tax=Eretmocerus hayati TaxID=131215 RepID=A0ACC2P8E9_9HYME|nr:hypothetical protein QAD02_015503 [Eretmocerus hayati]